MNRSLKSRITSRRIVALTTATSAFLMSRAINAGTVSWNVDASGDWNTGSNWSTGNVPGSTDDVSLNRSNTSYNITSSSANAMASFFNDENLNILNGTSFSVGGAFNNAGTVIFNGTANQRGSYQYGNFLDSGSVGVVGCTLGLTGGTSTGSFSLSGPNSFLVINPGPGYTFNAGSVSWDGNGSSSVKFQGGYDTVNIAWTANTGIDAGVVTFNNTVSGPMQLQNDNGSSEIVNFNGPMTGTLGVYGGTANLNQDTTLGSGSMLSAGTIAGTGNISFAGLNWTGGTLGAGSGNLIVPQSGSLSIDGTASTAKTLSANLTNNGTVNCVAGAGGTSVSMSSGSVLTNNGTFSINSSADLHGIASNATLTSATGAATFNNAFGATFTATLSGGGGAGLGPIVFNNAGTTNITSHRAGNHTE